MSHHHLNSFHSSQAIVVVDVQSAAAAAAKSNAHPDSIPVEFIFQSSSFSELHHVLVLEPGLPQCSHPQAARTPRCALRSNFSAAPWWGSSASHSINVRPVTSIV
jgi:hypothetical protein